MLDKMIFMEYNISIIVLSTNEEYSMKNGISWADTQAADVKWIRNEILWSIFGLMLLVGFGWLFLNPYLILQFVR